MQALRDDERPHTSFARRAPVRPQFGTRWRSSSKKFCTRTIDEAPPFPAPGGRCRAMTKRWSSHVTSCHPVPLPITAGAGLDRAGTLERE